jgi:hypothetical protein
LNVATLSRDGTAENILERLSDLTNNPDEGLLVPYREFNLDGKIYYFTPGGFSIAGSREPKRWEESSAATSPTRSGTTGPTTSKQ